MQEGGDYGDVHVYTRVGRGKVREGRRYNDRGIFVGERERGRGERREGEEREGKEDNNESSDPLR
jgi:hypothetical protein